MAIRSELTGLFDNETFSLTDRPLPTDEIIPTKMALKKKLNSSGGLDKELKARICLRGDIQINNGDHSWSPIAPIRLLKWFIAVVPFVAISSKVKYKYRLEISYQTLAIHEFLACHLHNIIYLYHFNNMTLAIHQIQY